MELAWSDPTSPDLVVGADELVELPAGPVSLAEFLAECGRTLGDPTAPDAVWRDRFLTAGLVALRQAPDGRRWVAVGLRCAAEPSTELWAELAGTARELLAGPASDFFFMRKAPGLRLRFEATDEARVSRLREALWDSADGWRRAGLVAEVTPAVYEPEQQLFGGARSMRHVHRLFTVDSLAWLDFHAGAAGDVPAWRFSLSLLRALMDGLGVVGWEDLDVWDRIRRQAFRTLPASVIGRDAFVRAATGVRAAWAATGDGADPVARVRSEVTMVASRWSTDYFAGPDACVGPREACTFATIFHWNRGGLSMLRQGLLAEVLAERRP